ncbi:GNAT family N-acetyltransferase [Methylobacterium frigidaeris]|uniref:N-acetyltransferase domain-containing protein n=1 Tax=Methylobacterium frigidaeris TaxID=2038277 RepID=A0AA37M2H4_9HYPH|nr:hypothetical protein MPEAHAMD_0325 [Methylobacterium frigidaeris]
MRRCPAIRPADERDLVSVASVYHRVWHETHGPHMPQAERDARDEIFFLDPMTNLMPNVILCEDEHAVVGFAAWTGTRLGQIFLDASVRGSGFAQRLMEAAERGLRNQDVLEAELRCLVGNMRARRFYERVGWHVSETVAEAVRGDVDGERRDFWVMRKRLIPRVP